MSWGEMSLQCFSVTLVSSPGSGSLFLLWYAMQQPLLALCFAWVSANKAPAWTPGAWTPGTFALASAINTVKMMLYTVQLLYFYERDFKFWHLSVFFCPACSCGLLSSLELPAGGSKHCSSLEYCQPVGCEQLWRSSA